MKELAFTIPVVPVAQPRQRTRIVTTAGGRQFAQNYTPKTAPVNAFKAAAQLALSEHFGGPPWDGPVMLEALFIFPRPGRLVWKSRPMPRVWHTVRPDRDNLEKSLMDALSKLLWRDDSQVCDGSIRKFYAAGDESPHVEVRAVLLEEPKPVAAGPSLFDAEGV